MTAQQVYDGSDAAATRCFYGRLIFCGPLGLIAINLFRAQKCSARAKQYRGGIRGVGSYKVLAYQRKEWSLAQLCTVLQQEAVKKDIRWGWKPDPLVPFGDQPSYVLYIDLPFIITNPARMSAAAMESGAPEELVYRQVSFHAPSRGIGPDYPDAWDGSHASAQRIIQFCDNLLADLSKQLPF